MQTKEIEKRMPDILNALYGFDEGNIFEYEGVEKDVLNHLGSFDFAYTELGEHNEYAVQMSYDFMNEKLQCRINNQFVLQTPVEFDIFLNELNGSSLDDWFDDASEIIYALEHEKSEPPTRTENDVRNMLKGETTC